MMVVRRVTAQEHEQMHTVESFVPLCTKQEHGLLLRHASVGLAITWRNGWLLCYSLLFWTFILK